MRWRRGEITAGALLLWALVHLIPDLFALMFTSDAELVDYKTDRVSDAAQLADRYAAQLAYYKQALELRLAKPITRCCLYSLHLSREVELTAQQLQESLSKPE